MLIIFYFKNNSKSVTQGNIKSSFDVKLMPGYYFFKDALSHIYSSAKAGTHKEDGWAESAYGNSKVGVTLMSFVQQREFDKDPREDIIVNAVSLLY